MKDRVLSNVASDAAWEQFSKMPSSNPGDYAFHVLSALREHLAQHPESLTELGLRWEFCRICEETYAAPPIPQESETG